ncbi:MAG: sugar-binding domain-containing protein [Tunicatimonas sp.]
MKPTKLLFSLLSVFVLLSCTSEEVPVIDLAGEWGFRTDSLDQGVAQAWYRQHLSGTINLPGSMAENGKGNPVSLATAWTGAVQDSTWHNHPEMAKYRQPGNIKIPFWLTPEKVYYGPAWYQKTVTIPESWKGQHITLTLERAHWETTLWVDSTRVGTANSLGTPHHYPLSKYLTPGEHILTLRVDNRLADIDVGENAHSVTDHTQTNWNGVIGAIELTASSPVVVENVRLYPDVANKTVRLEGTVRNFTGTTQSGQLIIRASHSTGEIPELTQEIVVDSASRFQLTYPMGEAPLLWDEFNPHLYLMHVEFTSEVGTHRQEITFGMRDFAIDGKHFTINGRPVFLRGTLECAIFPLTGYPPTDVAAWKRIFTIVQDHGLNHVRFHSWCPPEAAFRAADTLGVYLQVEASAWATVGDGAPIDAWLYQESEDIVAAYGNHPSFVMMTHGNEPAGDNHKAYLQELVNYMKKWDTRRLYTSGAGWPYLDSMDFYDNQEGRIQRWGDGLRSVINAQPPQTLFDYTELIQETPMPYVTHEMGQWCAYPNFREMSKYTGVLKPKNFEIFKETLAEHHLGHLADSFLLASGKLQALCYKADIEAALRTKDMAGFQLLDLHDFPGQGTALVGVLDAFWDEKGYISPEEYREFCSETVPLARLERRTFWNTDTLHVAVEVAHYGENPLSEVTPTWKLNREDGATFAQGSFSTTTIPIGNGTSLGKIAVPLAQLADAQKLTLTVQVGGHSNSWEVWTYPTQKQPIDNKEEVRVVQQLDAATEAYLTQGGTVLLNVTKGDVAADKGGDIGVGFSSIFWNTAWTKGQKPHTLGILCDPNHPALANFPTDYYSDWQWWDAMTHANAIITDDLSTELRPIVRVIDDWFENRSTALLFEARVGQGKLLVSGIDLHTDLSSRREAQQLLYSLKKYMVSRQFNPKTQLAVNDVTALFANEQD